MDNVFVSCFSVILFLASQGKRPDIIDVDGSVVRARDEELVVLYWLEG